MCFEEEALAVAEQLAVGSGPRRRGRRRRATWRRAPAGWRRLGRRLPRRPSSARCGRRRVFLRRARRRPRCEECRACPSSRERRAPGRPPRASRVAASSSATSSAAPGASRRSAPSARDSGVPPWRPSGSSRARWARTRRRRPPSVVSPGEGRRFGVEPIERPRLFDEALAIPARERALDAAQGQLRIGLRRVARDAVEPSPRAGVVPGEDVPIGEGQQGAAGDGQVVTARGGPARARRPRWRRRCAARPSPAGATSPGATELARRAAESASTHSA